jgi:hypothetical protein
VAQAPSRPPTTRIDERKRQTKVSEEVALEKVFDFSLVEEINRELPKLLSRHFNCPR